MVNKHVDFVTVQAVTSRFKPEWLLRLVVSSDVTHYGTGFQDQPEQGVGLGQLS